MQVEIFNPVDVYAALGSDETCFLSGQERDTHCGFGLHFDNAEALGAFGLAVVEEARRLLREQEVNEPGVKVEVYGAPDAM